MSTSLTDSVRTALASVYDPEFGVSVTDLGLIYEIVSSGRTVTIAATLTSMYCPAGTVILDGIKSAALSVGGVDHVEVNLVWDPAWTPERLTDAARQQLGWTGA